MTLRRRPPNKKDRFRTVDGVVHIAYRSGNSHFIRCNGSAVYVRTTDFIPATCLLCIKKERDREIANEERFRRWFSMDRQS